MKNLEKFDKINEMKESARSLYKEAKRQEMVDDYIDTILTYPITYCDDKDSHQIIYEIRIGGKFGFKGEYNIDYIPNVSFRITNHKGTNNINVTKKKVTFYKYKRFKDIFFNIEDTESFNKLTNYVEDAIKKFDKEEQERIDKRKKIKRTRKDYKNSLDTQTWDSKNNKETMRIKLYESFQDQVAVIVKDFNGTVDEVEVYQDYQKMETYIRDFAEEAYNIDSGDMTIDVLLNELEQEQQEAYSGQAIYLHYSNIK